MRYKFSKLWIVMKSCRMRVLALYINAELKYDNNMNKVRCG